MIEAEKGMRFVQFKVGVGVMNLMLQNLIKNHIFLIFYIG